MVAKEKSITPYKAKTGAYLSLKCNAYSIKYLLALWTGYGGDIVRVILYLQHQEPCSGRRGSGTRHFSCAGH